MTRDDGGEVTMNVLREALEQRDLLSLDEADTPSAYRHILAEGLISHEEIQIYLLLKILDRLEALAELFQGQSEEDENVGGKPKTSTPADRRLKENRGLPPRPQRPKPQQKRGQIIPLSPNLAQ